MKRKLVATRQDDLEWDLPEQELYDEVILAASAQFIEADITHADTLVWSSAGQTTGIGMFAMSTAKMDLVELFDCWCGDSLVKCLSFKPSQRTRYWSPMDLRFTCTRAPSKAGMVAHPVTQVMAS